MLDYSNKYKRRIANEMISYHLKKKVLILIGEKLVIEIYVETKYLRHETFCQKDLSYNRCKIVQLQVIYKFSFVHCTKTNELICTKN